MGARKKAAGKKRARKRAAGKKPKRRGTRARGRPRLEFDLTVVAALGQLRVPYEVLARKLDCSVDTVRARMREDGPQFDAEFSKAFHTGRADRNIALRQKQYEVAIRGSEKMLIHLGKHELDQGDKVTIEDPDHVIGGRQTNYDNLSLEELRLLESLVAKAEGDPHE